MANTHETLGSLFTDIADAIREADGSTGTIVADTFPDKIRNLSSGILYQEVASISRNGKVVQSASSGNYLHKFPSATDHVETKNDTKIDLVIIEFAVSDVCNISFIFVPKKYVIRFSIVDGNEECSFYELENDVVKINLDSYYPFPTEKINNSYSFDGIDITADRYGGTVISNKLAYEHIESSNIVMNTEARAGYVSSTNCGIPKLRIAAYSRVSV